jgi:hypothetical protein
VDGSVLLVGPRLKEGCKLVEGLGMELELGSLLSDGIDVDGLLDGGTSGLGAGVGSSGDGVMISSPEHFLLQGIRAKNAAR